MANYATNITTDGACKQDLASENPLITYAHLGLMAYQPLYRASCLKNPSTAAYCFADAITNYNNSADAYIYFLPLNISLVGGSQPTCTSCLKQTMNVFEAATSDRKLWAILRQFQLSSRSHLRGPNITTALKRWDLCIGIISCELVAVRVNGVFI
jgi:hypothetical protein